MLESLRAFGCDFGQGHHICPPLPADEAAEWLRAAAGSVAAI
jgi:EAL domain-containing protein (putative c-di-GMP-specific phosphodiesterase class I)